jgi:hypothetical protein
VVRADVQVGGHVPGEVIGGLDRPLGLVAHGRHRGDDLGEVPEHLVQAPQHRERPEHLRGGPPVLPAEYLVHDPLPCAEAVVDRAALETPLPQGVVDTAVVVGALVRTQLSGRLGDREVSGLLERERDTAQPDTVGTVRAQLDHPARIGAEGRVPGQMRASSTSTRTDHHPMCC